MDSLQSELLEGSVGERLDGRLKLVALFHAVVLGGPRVQPDEEGLLRHVGRVGLTPRDLAVDANRDGGRRPLCSNGSLVFEFSLCLSRARLGKTAIIYVTKVDQKPRFSYRFHSR